MEARMGKMEGRKSVDDVRNEATAAKDKRKAHMEKIAAYDLKYKADAKARRDNPPAPAEAKPAEAKPVEGEVKP
jgi:hypothetical protein